MNKSTIVLPLLLLVSFIDCRSQKPPGMAAAATRFLQTLSSSQKAKAQFAFTDLERMNWHYVPIERKGIPLKELTKEQRDAAFALLRTALSDEGYNKAIAIPKLEQVLKEVEDRGAGDTIRDSGKYYFSIFGDPAGDSIWGWRFEGHHVSFNFSSVSNQLVSGTPGFLGSNPAIVLSGPEKGMQVLKDETDLGFSLVHALDSAQRNKAVISKTAPAEIITGSDRKAMINDPKGILYAELTASQQKIFMQLLGLYIHRYTKLFAEQMMHELEEAGLNNLRFAWAGDQENGIGHPHYYRIQGPTIIIEYDNTQNNSNHVHTVVRDLKNDFGGDELLQHYKRVKHN